MSRSILRAIAVAAAALALGVTLQVVHILVLCEKGRLAAALERHEPVAIDTGYHFAITGESIFTCTTPHRLGPVVVHTDFGCYCAPVGTDPLRLGEELGGRCTLETARPSRNDATGICRNAHCLDPASEWGRP